MAEQNWYRRFVESYGPNFRTDISNPPRVIVVHVYDIYGVTDQDEKANISLDHTEGKFHSDRTIEIVAGEQQSRIISEMLIFIHTRNGDIAITASGMAR